MKFLTVKNLDGQELSIKLEDIQYFYRDTDNMFESGFSNTPRKILIIGFGNYSIKTLDENSEKLKKLNSMVDKEVL